MQVTRLFIKLFVKDYENVDDKSVRSAYGTMTSIVGIVINIILF